MNTEDFARFIRVVHDFKIEHSIHWSLSKERWQDLITNLGYNMTSLACMEVVFTKTQTGFVFFKGREGKFMFMVDHKPDGTMVTHIDPANVFLIGENE